MHENCNFKFKRECYKCSDFHLSYLCIQKSKITMSKVNSNKVSIAEKTVKKNLGNNKVKHRSSEKDYCSEKDEIIKDFNSFFAFNTTLKTHELTVNDEIMPDRVKDAG